jgi:hypothetical protein
MSLAPGERKVPTEGETGKHRFLVKWKSKSTGSSGYTEFTNLKDKESALAKASELDTTEPDDFHFVQEQDEKGNIVGRHDNM